MIIHDRIFTKLHSSDDDDVDDDEREKKVGLGKLGILMQ